MTPERRDAWLEHRAAACRAARPVARPAAIRRPSRPRECENPRMPPRLPPCPHCRAEQRGGVRRAQVQSLHAGQQRRRFGVNSLAKHAPPAAPTR